MIGECRPQMLIEATAVSLAPHAGWLDQLGYRAVLLGERNYRRTQSVRVVAMTELAGSFVEGMILLLPPDAREMPTWKRLQQTELSFDCRKQVAATMP